MPTGRSKDCGVSRNATANCGVLDEPPDADPHVRWCERERLVAAPYSISRDRRSRGERTHYRQSVDLSIVTRTIGRTQHLILDPIAKMDKITERNQQVAWFLSSGGLCGNGLN
jgi:hypothetical protein